MSNLTYIFVHGLSGWGSLRGNWTGKKFSPGYGTFSLFIMETT